MRKTIIAATLALSTAAHAQPTNTNLVAPAGIGIAYFVGGAIVNTVGWAVGAPIIGLLALPADRLINAGFGGEKNHTISGDAGVAREQGSESAKAWCGLFELSPALQLYDGIYFSAQENGWARANKLAKNDHCGRWAAVDSGEFDKITYEEPSKEYLLRLKNPHPRKR